MSFTAENKGIYCSVFFHFRTQDRCVVVVEREGADREVADREVADREGYVTFIAAIILSASYLLGFDLVLCYV